MSARRRQAWRRWTQVLVALLVTLSLAQGLVACGKKAAPTPPPGSDHPRKYPTQ